VEVHKGLKDNLKEGDEVLEDKEFGVAEEIRLIVIEILKRSS
jgi:hypothetical protein